MRDFEFELDCKFTRVTENDICGVSVHQKDNKETLIIPSDKFDRMLHDQIQRYLVNVEDTSGIEMELWCGEFIGTENSDQFRNRVMYTAKNLMTKGNEIKLVKMGYEKATIIYVKPKGGK